MKKRATLYLVFCAVLLTAGSASAEGIAAQDWVGNWVFTYENSVTQNITITDVCVKPDCPQGSYWEYIAKGKKEDDSDVQIRKIKFAPTQFMYYELSDEAILECGQECPNATIMDADADCNSFTVSEKTDPIKLVSGKRAGLPKSCSSDNSTICPATKIFGADAQNLNQLRGLRDSSLARTALGRKIISIYYGNSAEINAALERSTALQAVARKVFQAAALLK